MCSKRHAAYRATPDRIACTPTLEYASAKIEKRLAESYLIATIPHVEGYLTPSLGWRLGEGANR